MDPNAEETFLMSDNPAAARSARTEAKIARLQLALYVGLALLGATLIALVVVAVVALRNKSSSSPAPAAPFTGLAAAIQPERLFSHLEALSRIARAHRGTRAVAFGYNASLEYVESLLLEHAPYLTVERQPFLLSVPDLVGTPALSAVSATIGVWNLTYQVDFLDTTYSGSGAVTGPVFDVAAQGCTAADFVGMPVGSVAVIRRGSCSFHDKVAAAETAGAAGVLIVNYGDSPNTMGAFRGTLNEAAAIPAFGVAFAAGQALRGCATSPPVVSMRIVTKLFEQTTMNLIATTKTGDPATTIVLGSHLDSVEGNGCPENGESTDAAPCGCPGINDNGSGTALNLEVALNLAAAGPLVSRVRFAWWAAEELGLIGSEYYVATLSPTARAATALNLNVDMVGSVNGYQGIYNASSSDNATLRGPSVVIQRISEAFLQAHNVPYVLTDFTGRSDYGPFLDAGIPAGGADSGADDELTASMRDVFGGSANVQADTCYHQPCDSLMNVDSARHTILSRTIANTLQTLATERDLHGLLYGTSESARERVASERAAAEPLVTDLRVAHGFAKARWVRGERVIRE